MKEKTLVVTSDKPQIQVKVNGDLSLKGHDRLEVSAATRYSGNLTLKQDGDIIQVVCLDDCSLTVPASAVVSVERVGGDARVANITAEVHLQKVGGDLALLEIDAVDVEKVGGDCMVSHIRGVLHVQQTGGDFTGQDIQGAVSLEKVGGDILLQKVGGGMEARSGGDMRVGMGLPNLPACILRCSGDLQLIVQPNSYGVFTINSSGEDIVLNLAGNYQTIEKRSHSLTLGSGGEELTLQAGGDVLISDQPWEENILGEIPEDMGMESMRQFDEEINAHAERATRRAQEAARRAEQRVQAAMRRMEQSQWGMADRIRRDVMRGVSIRVGAPFTAAEPPREPVTDDERLMVLKMVQDKKITVDEAEKLLQAMEGKKL
jgi:hypothetical protein